MEHNLPLDQMSLEDKLRMLDLLWDDLCRRPDDYPSPAWHADELRNREQRVREGATGFKDWDEAKRTLREHLA